jgi:hypothetical protein
MNIKATAKQIMSAMQSDAFNEEACKQILRDAQIPREDYDNLVRDAMKMAAPAMRGTTQA